MRFARLIGASLMVVTVAGSGLFIVSPGVTGQEHERMAWAPGAPIGGSGLEVFQMGGARMGAAVRDVDAGDVTREQLASPSGAVVDEVDSDSPAAKAGLKSGDVVVSFDGERVRSARQLERLVEETPAGRTVAMSVQRSGAKVDLQVTPVAPEMSGSFRMAAPFERGASIMAGRSLHGIPLWKKDGHEFPAAAFHFDEMANLGAPPRTRLGVQVQELSGQLAEYFGVKAGALVSEVRDGSPAAKAGVKVGDVITAVNGHLVDGPAELRREVARVDEGKAAEISVTREKKAVTVKIEPEPVAKKVERRVRRTI